VLSSWLRCGARRLDLGAPRVMGIVNVTPDSFSDGGRFVRPDGGIDVGRVVAVAAAMVDAGAALLDVGGESTRPGAAPVTAAEELDRVMPVVERLAQLDTIVSVDTSKASVAREALTRGAGMINDVRGFVDDALRDAVAASDAALCVMHMRGEPRTMQDAPRYGDVVGEVGAFLRARAASCRMAGIEVDRIVIDPGFGFGKTLAHNIELLRRLDELSGDYPLLVGLSRKRMIGSITGRDVGARVAGSVAAALVAVQRGASIVRVHDVAETVDALRVLEALAEAEDREDG
jgi:dihydropteroate synthase